MTLFKTPTAQDVWLQMNCDRCYRHRDCTILERALNQDRKPKEWQRNTSRNVLMQNAYKCEEYRTSRPRPTRVKQFEDVSMFGDDTPYRVDVGYVPVDGDWPEKPGKETDHA